MSSLPPPYACIYRIRGLLRLSGVFRTAKEATYIWGASPIGVCSRQRFLVILRSIQSIFILKHLWTLGCGRGAIHFHTFWCKNLEKMLLPSPSWICIPKSRVPRGCIMVTTPPPPYISAPVRDRNEILKATRMFSGSSHPMELTEMLYDQTRSGDSKMAASKPEVPIS